MFQAVSAIRNIIINTAMQGWPAAFYFILNNVYILSTDIFYLVI